ncbi:MAG: hypothetical protein ACR2F6_03120 [Mycobacteriales bacterium]
MTWWMWTIVIVLLAILAAQILARRSLRPGVDPTKVRLDPEYVAHLRELATHGQPIRAIAELRKQTGIGLADAKRMVDRMSAGGPRE